MAIVQTVQFSDFKNAFKAYNRIYQFSESGLAILFDYLEELSDDTGEDVELDVIAICCEYEEATFKEVMDMFPDFFEGIDTDDVTSRDVANALGHETIICGIDPHNEIVVFHSF